MLESQVPSLNVYNLLKRDPVQVFSCEISQIFKSILLYRTSGDCFWKGSEGTSLVKILQSYHFNIFGINHRCFSKMAIKQSNEEAGLLKRLSLFLLFVFSLAI